MTTPTDNDVNVQAAQHALNELDEATQLAREAVGLPQPSSPEESAAPLSDDERAARNEERVKQFIKRANRQRNMGRQEMERIYVGVMVVERDLKIFDPHLASSVTRFLALTDKTIHLLSRIGSQYMTDAQVEKVRQSIQEKIEEYAAKGRQALAVAAELAQKNRAENFMWIEPHYMAPALDFKFQVKSRNALLLAEAAQHWDEAIRLMCEMEFNACATASQINEIRLNERRLFSGINRHCANIVFGMSRRSMADLASAKAKEGKAPAQPDVQPDATPALVQEAMDTA